MKEKKCILLVRVSTDAQSYDEQEKELYELALHSGYAPSQIAAIAEKESGRKLSEEDRRGLKRMKELVETGEYDCVFAWEISRIARTKKVLFSILEYLVKRGIQLIIKEPFIKLLKPDLTIDEGAETIFTLYAQLAETEMRNKMSRFERAKREYYAKGKYMGGKYLLGYKVNEEGYWVIDEDTAPIIRLIFDLYISGEYSMTELAKEMKSRGYFTGSKNITNIKNTISHILKNESYRGTRARVYRHRREDKKINGVVITQYPSVLTDNNNIYPQLIDDDTWEKCVQRRKENLYRTKTKTLYLLTPIIHCRCGASYCANSIDGTYQCRTKHNSVEKGLEHDPSISINILESLAWFVAMQELHIDMAKGKSTSKQKYEEDIAILQQKKDVSDRIIVQAMERRADLDEAYYVRGQFDKERYDVLAAKQNEAIAAEQENIRKYDAQIRQLTSLIESEITFDDLLNSISQSFDSMRGGTDLNVMRDLIKRYIVDIHIEEIPGRNKNFYKKVIIETINDVANKHIADKLVELRADYVVANVFYVSTIQRKAFYDEDMTNEVPMVYIDRIKRRREHTTENGKKVSKYPLGYIRKGNEKKENTSTKNNDNPD